MTTKKIKEEVKDPVVNPASDVDFGPAGQKKVEAWKAEHETIGYFQVGDHYAYLRSPDFATANMALERSRSKPAESGRILIENCGLEMSAGLKSNDMVYASLCWRAILWLNTEVMPKTSVQTF